jgi:hypothetical protein
VSPRRLLPRSGAQIELNVRGRGAARQLVWAELGEGQDAPTGPIQREATPRAVQEPHLFFELRHPRLRLRPRRPAPLPACRGCCRPVGPFRLVNGPAGGQGRPGPRVRGLRHSYAAPRGRRGIENVDVCPEALAEPAE